ncbi:hypothetical protein IAD21_01658 [Abditibacteriota bacterium]|nr:hypothetical protein IAD21_01658 [Abditibacteriota bacterium]
MLQAGDVVQAEFPGSQGIKKRPCIVISSEIYHKTRPDVLLTVVTSNIAIATAPTDYVLYDWEEGGLSVPSAVRIYISARLQYQVSRIGRLSEADWSEVQARVKLALEI